MRGELDDGGDAGGRGRRAPRRRPDAGWLLLATVVPLAVALAVAVPMALASSAGSGLRRASGAFSVPRGPVEGVVLDSTVAPDRPPTGATDDPYPAPTSTRAMAVAQAAVADTAAPVVTTTTATAPVVASTTTTVAPFRLVSGVGDSIMVGATGELSAALLAAGAAFAVHARVGRPFGEGVAAVASLVTAHDLGDAVIVHLGTNGAIDDAIVRSLLDQLVAVRRVVLVNVRAPVAWEAAANETLAAVGATYPNVRLVDWHGAGDGHDELFWSDGIHLRPAGNVAYAQLLTAALFAR